MLAKYIFMLQNRLVKDTQKKSWKYGINRPLTILEGGFGRSAKHQQAKDAFFL